MKKTNIAPVGSICVQDGEYEHNGVMRKRWQPVAKLFATPHHSHMAVKFNATPNGAGVWASVFWDEGCRPNFEDKLPEGTTDIP